MTTVFVAGSIAIKTLDEAVRDRLETIVASDFSIAIGDAKGVDSLVQDYLRNICARNVVVYCTGRNPRNNLGNWRVINVKSNAPKGTREYYTAKDRAMARESDFGLMIWDQKSPGTLSNVVTLNELGKKSVVFITPENRFQNIVDNDGVVALSKSIATEEALQRSSPKKVRARKPTTQTSMDF